VEDTGTEKKTLLLDPNPEFGSLEFGEAQAITFKTANGQQARGVIYLPVGYQSGRQYPLVIQTHALMVDRFAIDGPYTTAFAAQPLAGKGFVVAQLEEDWGRVDTPNEVTDEASQYEGVIDFLTAKEIIDPKRVGIIGFSRTGLAVEYVLTHSKYHFAAASLADISDAGYFRYIALLNASGFGRDSEIVNGDIPFGDGLTSWLKSAPGFNLDKVDSPVLMEANDRMSLLFEWEWFAGLSRLGRPVQLVYLPDGAHVVTKPSHRVVSQQGNVDWFRFWLQDYEDPDPAKIDQYKRWRELRKMQERKS
jgi:dipeptidyl aminopeptidase/acylaminoacyl peptidase